MSNQKWGKNDATHLGTFKVHWNLVSLSRDHNKLVTAYTPITTLCPLPPSKTKRNESKMGRENKKNEEKAVLDKFRSISVTIDFG